MPVSCVALSPPPKHSVNFQRYICWMHTTPTILVLLKLMSKTITVKEVSGCDSEPVSAIGAYAVAERV